MSYDTWKATDRASWWAEDDDPNSFEDEFEAWLKADQEAEDNSWVEWAEAHFEHITPSFDLQAARERQPEAVARIGERA